MEAIFLELTKQLNSSVFILLAILVVAFWLIYKAGRMTESFSGFTKKSDKIDTSIDAIKESLASVKATTDLLYKKQLSTMQSQSPLSLTSKGEIVATAISADEMINNHWDDIEAEISRSNTPNNPYDIQKISLDIARNCFDTIFSNDERNRIKTYAYSIGMDLLEIYPIVGIKIRDRILKERNIDLTEIDKYDPEKSASDQEK